MKQLFRKLPDIYIVTQILKTIGLQSIKENHFFSIEELKFKYNTLEQINNLKSQLENYYYKCKAKIYLDNIKDYNNIITIVRQFITPLNFKLQYVESYKHKKKCRLYYLSKNITFSIEKREKTIIFLN